MSSLNPPQLEAVNTLSGPLLVLAGAGTGKTRVVTFRIAKLIRLGIVPERILAVTFTNKAAGEMRERVTELLGKKHKTKPEVSTFHSLCVRVLRRHITRLGYPQRFVICDRGDQESVARAVLREIRVDSATLRPGDLLAMISRWKNASLRPAEAAATASTDREHLAATAYRRYQKQLKLQGMVDFDDLLLCTEELFEQYPEARRAEASRFDHLLIDEYQDTNGSQYRIVKSLAARHRNLCVVGDDDQSIYAWRGAEVRHILQFQRDWPEAKIVRLEDNYRCTDAILQLANRLIAYNKTRYPKILRAARPGGERPQVKQYADEAAEARETVADIAWRLRTPGIEPRDLAILFRTNEQPRAFETELRRAKIPYVLIGGMSFFDRKEVRDVLSYLRLFDNPTDEPALLRIFNTPPRGIADSTVEKIKAKAVAAGAPLWNIVAEAQQINELRGNAGQAVARFHRLISETQGKLKRLPITNVVREFLQTIDYQGYLQRTYPDAGEQQNRWNTVEEVINALARYESEAGKKANLSEFIDDALLGDRDFDNDKEKQLNRNAVALMTLHSAKGLEFPEVYLVGLEEGILPHHRSLGENETSVEEERRLCYVGITRAQHRLTLSLPLSRMKWGKPRDTIPSRFLYEITGQADNPHYKQVLAGKPPGEEKRTRGKPKQRIKRT